MSFNQSKWSLAAGVAFGRHAAIDVNASAIVGIETEACHQAAVLISQDGTYLSRNHTVAPVFYLDRIDHNLEFRLRDLQRATLDARVRTFDVD